MSEQDTTNQEEIAEEAASVTVRIQVNKLDAENILASLGDKFPPVESLNEIHLLIDHFED